MAARSGRKSWGKDHRDRERDNGCRDPRSGACAECIRRERADSRDGSGRVGSDPDRRGTAVPARNEAVPDDSVPVRARDDVPDVDEPVRVWEVQLWAVRVQPI